MWRLFELHQGCSLLHDLSSRSLEIRHLGATYRHHPSQSFYQWGGLLRVPDPSCTSPCAFGPLDASIPLLSWDVTCVIWCGKCRYNMCFEFRWHVDVQAAVPVIFAEFMVCAPLDISREYDWSKRVWLDDDCPCPFRDPRTSQGSRSWFGSKHQKTTVLHFSMTLQLISDSQGP